MSGTKGSNYTLEVEKTESVGSAEIRDGTLEVVVQGYKEPTKWIILLKLKDRIGALRVQDSNLQKDSANVLKYRIKDEFGFEANINDAMWKEIREQWSDQSTVVM